MTRALAAKMRPIIEEIVEEKLSEMLGDPERALCLRPTIRRELRRRLSTRKKNVPVAKAAAVLGLKW